MNKKVIHMVTLPQSLGLMNGQLQYLRNKGFNLGVVSSPGKQLEALDVNFKKAIPMAREISPIKDLHSLLKIIKYFNKEKPNIVNTGTPKAGFLGILASYFTRVPIRIYTLRGLRLETETGLKRKVLWLTEKIACTLATEVICISPSLLEEARTLKLLKNNKGTVLGKGSSNGIRLSKYPEKNDIKLELQSLKETLGLTDKHFVLGFVGRLTKDKGIEELLLSFKVLQKKYSNIKLLILGRIESQKGITIDVNNELENNKDIIYLGYIKGPEKYFYIMDVLIFPTYREGFGNVSIQAQAAGTPVIASNVTGAKDTIKDGKTGFLVPPKDVESIVEKVTILKKDKNLTKQFNKNARDFVECNFKSIDIWSKINLLYIELLSK